VQQQAAVLNGELVELDQPPQQRQGQPRLLEPGAGHHAGDVQPARVGPVAVADVDAEPGRPGTDLVDLAHELLEAALLAAFADPLLPAAPPWRGPLEDLAEERQAPVDRQALEGVDPEGLEEAAGRVEVLLVRGGAAQQGDDLGPVSRALAHSLTEAIPAPMTT
jgi:hypothetical protein